MRNLFVLFLSILSVSIVKANGKIEVKPTINEVTVFLDRAQLSSSVAAHINPGTTEIVLTGLAPSVDPQSIQVSGKGDFIIMGVQQSLNYLHGQKKAHEIAVLEDSIEAIQLRLNILKNTKDVYTKEEQMILANQAIGSKDHGVNPDVLEDMADFFRDRLIEIRSEQLKDEIRIKKTSEKLEKFQNQLNELNREINQPTSEILVTVSSKVETNVIFYIDYVVSNAGWYPLYDLRAKDTKSPVQLMYKAQVHQNTGVDWNNVKLKLSTSNPSLGGTKPMLYPWYLNFYEKPVVRTPRYKHDRKSEERAYMAMPSKQSTVSGMAAPEEDAYSTADYTEVVQTTLAAEFNISIPYSIESGGKGQLVDVQSHQLPASYKYSAVPKLDKDAFLLGRVTGWEDLNLLSGNANIYFEGTYVGQSFIDLNNTKDTLDLSLGRDAKVVIERKTLKDFTSKSFFGSNKKEEYAYEIIVRNNKKESVDITIEDQIPVSQNKDIEVEMIDNGGSQYDATTGKLTWNLTIEGSDSKSMAFKYSVKYPKNKKVSGL